MNMHIMLGAGATGAILPVASEPDRAWACRLPGAPAAMPGLPADGLVRVLSKEIETDRMAVVFDTRPQLNIL